MLPWNEHSTRFANNEHTDRTHNSIEMYTHRIHKASKSSQFPTTFPFSVSVKTNPEISAYYAHFWFVTVIWILPFHWIAIRNSSRWHQAHINNQQNSSTFSIFSHIPFDLRQIDWQRLNVTNDARLDSRFDEWTIFLIRLLIFAKATYSIVERSKNGSSYQFFNISFVRHKESEINSLPFAFIAHLS